jgi:hypothetical protein
MQLAIELQIGDHLPTIGLETTIEVMDLHPGQKRDRGVGHFRRQPLGKGVLALVSPGHYQILIFVQPL